MSTTNPEPAADGSADAEDAPDQLSYEQARDQLVEVVRALESGGLDLERSLSLWERGEALAVRCEHLLAGAGQRVERALAERTAGEQQASGDGPSGDGSGGTDQDGNGAAADSDSESS